MEDARGGEIDLLLIGYELPNITIDSVRGKMGQYNLHNTKLNIRQGLNAKQEIDFSQIKASILEDVLKKDSSARIATDQKVPVLSKTFPDISREIKALYPLFQLLCSGQYHYSQSGHDSYRYGDPCIS